MLEIIRLKMWPFHRRTRFESSTWGAKPRGIHSHLHQADTKHFQHKIGFDYSEIRLNFDLFRNEIEYYGTNHG